MKMSMELHAPPPSPLGVHTEIFLCPSGFHVTHDKQMYSKIMFLKGIKWLEDNNIDWIYYNNYILHSEEIWMETRFPQTIVN